MRRRRSRTVAASQPPAKKVHGSSPLSRIEREARHLDPDDVLERQRVDRRHQQGVGKRPGETEGGALILVPQVAPDQVPHEVAIGPGGGPRRAFPHHVVHRRREFSIVGSRAAFEAFGRVQHEGSYLAFIAVVVVAAVAYYFWQPAAAARPSPSTCSSTTAQSTEFRPAEQEGGCSRSGQQTIKGETKPAIFMHAASRLIFPASPSRTAARLRVFLGRQGRGVGRRTAATACCSASASPTAAYQELLNQHVDPRHNANDRGWLPVGHRPVRLRRPDRSN